MTPQAVEELIDQTFEALSPELQRAARWLRQNPAALALQSMRSTAREAGVAPATMTRLAQRLGFDGFEDLRAPFARQLAGRMPMAAPPSTALASERLQAVEPATRINALQQDNVASVVSLNLTDSLRAAAEALLQARRVAFLGLRASCGTAFYMHYIYGQVLPHGMLLSDRGGTLVDQLAQIERDDVLVVVSQAPYARQSVECVRQAAAQEATVISLTDSALSPTARRVPHVLLFATATSSCFRSTTGAVALAEALVATVAAMGGARIQRHLQQTHEQLRRHGVYWERPASGRHERSTGPGSTLKLASDR